MNLLEEYQYPIIGGAIGAIIAICIFTIGFWKMLLLFLLIALGSYIGFYLERTGYIDKKVKKGEAMVQENKKTLDNSVDAVSGTLTYEDKVIQKIVGLALEKVDGLLAVDGGFLSNLTGKLVNTDDVTSGVGVEVGKQQVAVDLKIVAEYKKYVPDIYKNIKEVVSKEVKGMTDLEVVEVNVDVIDVKTKEQQKQDEQSLQDKVGDAAKSTGRFTSEKVDQVKDKVSDDDEPRVK